MAEVTIQYKKKSQRKLGSLKLAKYAKQQPQLLKNAFKSVGSIVTRQVTRNLSGESHTKFPGNSNPYPGVVTGTLRRAVRWLPEKPWGVRITVGGIAEKYAPFQNKLRPYMLPSFEQAEGQVWAVLKKFIVKPLR